MGKSFWSLQFSSAFFMSTSLDLYWLRSIFEPAADPHPKNKNKGPGQPWPDLRESRDGRLAF